MLVRMVTRGWQVWAPSVALLFHQWERGERSTSYQACGQVRHVARLGVVCGVFATAGIDAPWGLVV
jgi:hypothetical protein